MPRKQSDRNTWDMLDMSKPPQGDDLERIVAASLAGALDSMLRRREGGDRLTLVRTLRSQMERVLADAPISEDPVKAVALRARMAALFDAEFTRMEAAEMRRGGPNKSGS